MTKRILSITMALIMVLGLFTVTAVNAEDIKILGSLSIKVGETKPLSFTDPDGNVVSVLWESTNPDIASVTSDGVVTGKKAGSCMITTWWNGKSFGVNLTVMAKASPYNKMKNYLKKHGEKYDNGKGYLDYYIKWYEDGYVLWANYDTTEYVNMFIGKPYAEAQGEFDAKEGLYLAVYNSGIKRAEYFKRNTSGKYSVYEKTYKKSTTLNTATMKLKHSIGPKLKSANAKAHKLAKAGFSLWDKFLGARMKLSMKKFGFVYKTTAKKISLSKTKLTLKAGNKYTLKLKNAKASKVRWTSSAKSVATVSKKGVVKAKKKGSAVITAKYKSKKYKCRLTVKSGKLTAKQAYNKLFKYIKKHGSYNSDELSYVLTQNSGSFTYRYYAQDAGTGCIRFSAETSSGGNTEALEIYLSGGRIGYSNFWYCYGTSTAEASGVKNSTFVLKENLSFFGDSQETYERANALLKWVFPEFDTYISGKAKVSMKKLGFKKWK